MATKKKILFIVNPISGTSRKSGVEKTIRDTVDSGCFDYSIVATRYGGHAFELARQAVIDGFDAVVAVGGDGTVNEVGCALARSATALGVVPCGSGNGLARHLMLPMNVRRAVNVINKFIVHDLDYGVINDMPFFCTCGMGFDAFISMKFAEAGKRGPITYLENILREGLKYEPETYEIQDGSGTILNKAFLISCANASQYGNNAYIAPRASMSDGLLDVVVMEPFNVMEAPQLSIDMFNKTLDKNPNIKTFKTERIHVHREKAGFVHVDGDPVMTGADVDVAVVNRGIKMIVNPDAEKAKRQPSAMQTAFSVFFNDIINARADKRRLPPTAKDIFRRFRKILSPSDETNEEIRRRNPDDNKK